VRGTR